MTSKKSIPLFQSRSVTSLSGGDPAFVSGRAIERWQPIIRHGSRAAENKKK
jgi:hypothetical protein